MRLPTGGRSEGDGGGVSPDLHWPHASVAGLLHLFFVTASSISQLHLSLSALPLLGDGLEEHKLGGALEDFVFCKFVSLGPILGPFGAQNENVGPCPMNPHQIEIVLWVQN